jgi:class 3 adenylate cyclase
MLMARDYPARGAVTPACAGTRQIGDTLTRVLDQIARRLYARMGPRYRVLFMLTQIPASVLVALGVIGVLAAFYRPEASRVVVVAVAASAFTAVGVMFSIVRQRRGLAELSRWRERDAPTAEQTIAAWDAATNFPMRSFRRDSLTTNAIAAFPSVVAIYVFLDLDPVAIPALLGAAGLAAAYGTIVTYSIAEFLMRPAVEEIAAALPDDFTCEPTGLPIRKRLIITLPVFTATAGLLVSAIVTDHGDTRMLAISLVASVVVSLALSLELTLLLSRAITDPIGDLRRALARVTAGDYEVRVPVVSSDDLGALSNAFNHMASGLAEREQLREAFGTYLDKDVARFILDTSFPKDGVEVHVTVMFCDAHAFTEFAERSSPREVVSALNTLFERIVPIIARHGGHVDKFLGDGVLAVFGVPEGYRDHADRALAAGLEIIREVNRREDSLPVGVGLNTGPVIAGSIGGAGRLNFSVIGDTVNVAARVEETTRGFGDSLLLTESTRAALTGRDGIPLASRGAILLKGKTSSIELFAATAQGGDGEGRAQALHA